MQASRQPSRFRARRIFVFLLIYLTAAFLATPTTGQQAILWQGTVKPEQINVYASPSTTDRVTKILRQGDLVSVVLEINVMGDAWCRIEFAGQSGPLGDVLCLNLERNPHTSTLVAHNEPIANKISAESPPVKPNGGTASSAGVLTNKDIVDMNAIGLPPEVLVAKIKSSVCNFDTSPQELQQLKSSGLPNPVILAMVQAPIGEPQPPTPAATASADGSKPISSTTVVSPAPKHQGQQGEVRPCVILKRMGPADEITSHLYSFGIRGKQFQFVEGELPAGLSFHGRLTDHDVRGIENKGGKVVIIEVKYTTQDLDHARQECREQ